MRVWANRKTCPRVSRSPQAYESKCAGDMFTSWSSCSSVFLKRESFSKDRRSNKPAKSDKQHDRLLRCLLDESSSKWRAVADEFVHLRCWDWSLTCDRTSVSIVEREDSTEHLHSFRWTCVTMKTTIEKVDWSKRVRKTSPFRSFPSGRQTLTSRGAETGEGVCWSGWKTIVVVCRRLRSRLLNNKNKTKENHAECREDSQSTWRSGPTVLFSNWGRRISHFDGDGGRGGERGGSTRKMPRVLIGNDDWQQMPTERFLYRRRPIEKEGLRGNRSWHFIIGLQWIHTAFIEVLPI